MCKVACKVSTTRRYEFSVDSMKIEISDGSYNHVSVSRQLSPYVMTHQYLQFSDINDFKKFCEKSLQCIKEIENERV